MNQTTSSGVNIRRTAGLTASLLLVTTLLASALPLFAHPACAQDTTPPEVMFTNPTDGEMNVPLDIPITIQFNENMDQMSVQDALVVVPDVDIFGFYWDSQEFMRFTLASPMAENTTYTVTIRTSATDRAGNPLAAPYEWSFTTESHDNYSADLDYDDLPDGWEYEYFGTTEYPGNYDYDGDGASNLEEYEAGTDPTDPSSHPSTPFVHKYLGLLVLLIAAFALAAFLIWLRPRPPENDPPRA